MVLDVPLQDATALPHAQNETPTGRRLDGRIATSARQFNSRLLEGAWGLMRKDVQDPDLTGMVRVQAVVPPERPSRPCLSRQ